ncbi:MAG: hypothetical protein ABSG43_30635 [Solirubrobacteraceae bacterium]
MPPDAQLIEILREVNRNLRSALLRLRPERRHCSSIKPHDFSDLLSHLLRASECVQQSRADRESSAAFDDEALEYRRNLEALKRFLPDLQVRLLAEKSRLEAARAHVTAAAVWAQAGKAY